MPDPYKACALCPNRCGVDRTLGRRGVCGETSQMRLAWAGLHRGEEPPVSGRKGSGMLFFTGCPLHCAYCQNFQISNSPDPPGIAVSSGELCSMMLALQEMGAASVNFVTATQFIPSAAEAIRAARKRGLRIPIVWNSSGYEDIEALKLIDDLIDLYLVDVKTLDRAVAAKFCGRADYPDVVVPVMDFLRARHPRTYLRKGRLYGVLVRHLVFPGTLQATLDFLSWYGASHKDSSYLSLMVQFVPPVPDPALRPVTEEEYDLLVDRLEELGIDNGFCQELEGPEKERLWLPDFTREQPFAPGFADPLPAFLEMARSSRTPRP